MQVRYAFNLTRVWQHYNTGNFAIISAYRSDNDEEVNEARAKALKDATRKMGYGYVEVQGMWVEQEGEHAGEEFAEYALFIPGITFDDAIYLGTGDYYDGESQWSIIYADEESIYELRANPDNPQIVAEYPKLETNFQKSWNAYSKHKGKKWRYTGSADSSVTWTMTEPPPARPHGYVEHRAADGWRDDAPHDFFHRRQRKGG